MHRRLSVQLGIDVLSIATITVVAMVCISLACSLLGWPLLPDYTERVYTLEDGTQHVALNDAESAQILKDHGLQVRRVVRHAPGLPGGNLIFTAAVAPFVALIGYVMFRRRRQLRSWFQLSPQIVGQGVALGALFVVLGFGYEQLIDFLGIPRLELVDTWREMIPSGPAMILIAVVLAPIAEELYFRGHLFEQLSEWRGPMVATWGTAILFALPHLIPVYLPIYIVFGLLFAQLRKTTGGLAAPMIAHALTNLAAFLIG